jgi:hydrogenase maturation protein HypF
MQTELEKLRLNVHVNGIVQGVGFRPFIYLLAKKYDLHGFVTNTPKGVVIEAEGNKKSLDSFLKSISSEAPPLSVVQRVTATYVPTMGEDNFKIISSEIGEKIETSISPDVGLCKECEKELFDPNNRRYLYPFINCTHCGPRFTIIHDLPYDRPKTSMARFTMCKSCQSEYDNPEDRRFHAQPNACPDCGPEVWYENDEHILAKQESAIEQAAEDLLDGKILAVKGLGGFHLMVDALNDSAVSNLRERKVRYEKPFALMADSLETVESLCHISSSEKILLQKQERPIVLLKKKNKLIAKSVAPKYKHLGVMLPYTPLHYIILHTIKKIAPERKAILVATSANLSNEPIVRTNAEAKKRLGQIADRFLLHNREIVTRCDDSVIKVVDNKNLFFRRSRGYTPRSINIENEGEDILALGGDLKNAFCILKNNQAFVSQHIGDLENLETNEVFKKNIRHLKHITDCDPKIIAHDFHPNFFSTQFAEATGKRTIAIQHHHAHFASVYGEYGLNGNAIGFILDGTGYGLDGNIWGGEVFVGNLQKIHRYAHLEPMPLPGGESAIREPWKIAYAYLYKIYGRKIPKYLDIKKDAILSEMIKKNINTPYTTSMGRLFDAVSALLGICTKIHYEGQAAIELMLKAKNINTGHYDYDLPPRSGGEIKLFRLFDCILRELKYEKSEKKISEKFHRTIVNLLTDIAVQIREEQKINQVVLSGGVFQNHLLTRSLLAALKQNNFSVYLPEKLPVNDGGIAFGQALLAREKLKMEQQIV